VTGASDFTARAMWKRVHTLHGTVRFERLWPLVAARIVVSTATGLYAAPAFRSPGLPLTAGTLHRVSGVPNPEGGWRDGGALAGRTP
jgi:hypothetical protein